MLEMELWPSQWWFNVTPQFFSDFSDLTETWETRGFGMDLKHEEYVLAIT